VIYKQVQIDKFLKRPDNSLRAVLVYGSNEGLMSEYVKSFTKAICPDVNDQFRVRVRLTLARLKHRLHYSRFVLLT